MVNDMCRGDGVFSLPVVAHLPGIYNEDRNMRNTELMDKIRRKLDKCDGQTKASHGISELLCKMDTALEMLKGIVVHGKEATDEYNDFPSDSNRIVMELARQNVVHAA